MVSGTDPSTLQPTVAEGSSGSTAQPVTARSEGVSQRCEWTTVTYTGTDWYCPNEWLDAYVDTTTEMGTAPVSFARKTIGGSCTSVPMKFRGVSLTVPATRWPTTIRTTVAFETADTAFSAMSRRVAIAPTIGTRGVPYGNVTARVWPAGNARVTAWSGPTTRIDATAKAVPYRSSLYASTRLIPAEGASPATAMKVHRIRPGSSTVAGCADVNPRSRQVTATETIDALLCRRSNGTCSIAPRTSNVSREWNVFATIHDGDTDTFLAKLVGSVALRRRKGRDVFGPGCGKPASAATVACSVQLLGDVVGDFGDNITSAKRAVPAIIREAVPPRTTQSGLHSLAVPLMSTTLCHQLRSRVVTVTNRRRVQMDSG
jgi:hypothetical protein